MGIAGKGAPSLQTPGHWDKLVPYIDPKAPQIWPQNPCILHLRHSDTSTRESALTVLDIKAHTQLCVQPSGSTQCLQVTPGRECTPWTAIAHGGVKLITPFGAPHTLECPPQSSSRTCNGMFPGLPQVKCLVLLVCTPKRVGYVNHCTWCSQHGHGHVLRLPTSVAVKHE